MTGGGIPAGDVVLLTGPGGQRQDDVRRRTSSRRDCSDGESCVVAVFEEYPEAYLARAKTLVRSISRR